MNWYTLFYLFSILEKLTTLFIVGSIICTIGYVIFSIIHYVCNYDLLDNINSPESSTYKKAEKWIKTIRVPRVTLFVLGVIFYLAIIFTPNRKDVIIIIAGGAVGQFITSDSSARALPADITRFLRGEILKATSELTDEARESIGIDTEAEKIKKMSREELEKLLLEKKEKTKTK